MDTDKFNADQNEERDPVTHDIIGAAFEVYRVLGYGFRLFFCALNISTDLGGPISELGSKMVCFQAGRV
jgi:hypothetical protein